MTVKIEQNVSLKKFSNFKIGGKARYFLDFKSPEELIKSLEQWEALKKTDPTISDQIFVISGGTNILFSDDGFSGLIIHNSINFIEKSADTFLEIGAGTLVRELNEYCIAHSLSGTEWSGGLPGSVGGAVFGNAGAFGGETKDTVFEVESYDYATGQVHRRSNKECAFAYRNSVYKAKNLPEVILKVKIKVKLGDKKVITDAIEEKINYRKLRQPLEYPNIGSIFKNIDLKLANKALIEKCQAKIKNDPFPVIPVAYLIFLADLTGRRVGGAKVSEKHPNMIINIGGATAKDVKKLIEIVKGELYKKFKIRAETEIRELDF